MLSVDSHAFGLERLYAPASNFLGPLCFASPMQTSRTLFIKLLNEYSL